MSFDVEWVRSRFPGREVHWYPRVASTMNQAAQLARLHCPSGTAIIADEQTAGQGRYGRPWHSEPGMGLYVSVILRGELPGEAFPALNLAIGLAAREAILAATRVECDLRWPNDLLHNGRKCGGILANVESGATIAGIGINVNHDAFPEDLEPIATSMRRASGAIHAREPLLAALLQRIDHWTGRLARESVRPVRDEFLRRSSYASGRRVIVDNIGPGTTAGLDESGFLLLRRDNGETVRVLTGGVRPA